MRIAPKNSKIYIYITYLKREKMERTVLKEKGK